MPDFPTVLARGISSRGSGDIRTNLSKIIKEFPKEILKDINAEMQIEMTEMQKIVPYDTGHLHDSHRLLPPFIVRNIMYQDIIAGGPDAPYAPIVHEDLEVFHKPPTQAKWMEVTLKASQPHMAGRIAARNALRRAAG